jgi:hypothetical protein
MACSPLLYEADGDDSEWRDAKSHAEKLSAGGNDGALLRAMEGKSIADVDAYERLSVHDAMENLKVDEFGKSRYSLLEFPNMSPLWQRPWMRAICDNVTARASVHLWRSPEKELRRANSSVDFSCFDDILKYVQVEEIAHSGWSVCTPQQVVTTIHIDAVGSGAMLTCPANGVKIIMVFKCKGIESKSVYDAALEYEALYEAVIGDNYDEMKRLAHVGVLVLGPGDTVCVRVRSSFWLCYPYADMHVGSCLQLRCMLYSRR